jgi:hypothetical protein
MTRRRGWVAAGLVLGAAAFVALLWFGWRSERVFGPPDIAGGIVRVATPAGERIAFVTTQWESRVITLGGGRHSGSTRRRISDVHADLWLLDAATAQPLQRLRLASAKQLGDVRALGVDQGVLWVQLPALVGIRLADGARVADRARIEAANPALAGLLPAPSEATVRLPSYMQRLLFTPGEGLVVVLEDARRVRIDPLTLQAAPAAAPGTAVPPAEGRLPMRSVAAGMQWNALLRGVSIGSDKQPRDWLGLIAEHELARIAKEGQATAVPDYAQPARYKLYRARYEPFDNFFGRHWRLRGVEPLPQATEYLQAGLLAENPDLHQRRPLLRRGPDSVFLLHRERLGDDGRLQIARIAGPAGTPVWQTALPLSRLSAWMPGDRHALLVGAWNGAERHPTAELRDNPVPQIVALDLDSGAFASFNLDLRRDWPATAPPP